MLVNPEIQAWFDKLQGQRLGGGGGGASPRPIAGLGAEQLAGIVKPGSGMFGFNAPAINPRFQLHQPAPYAGLPSPSGIPAAPISGGGGARDLGGGAIAAGLGKLGQGVETGIKAYAAKKAQQDQIAAMAKVPGLPPLPPLRPSTPSPPGRPAGIGAPTPETFPPVGAASDTPLLAQSDPSSVQAVPPIGGGGSLPTLAQGGPGGASANTAGMTPAQSHAYNFFTSKGWSPNFSIAMTAALTGESTPGLNTAPLQGNDGKSGGGNGIANWSASRWNTLGRPQGLDAQLNAVYNEVNRSYPRVAGLASSNADPRTLTNSITGGLNDGGRNGSPFAGSYLTPQSANGYNRWQAFSKVSGVNGAPEGGAAPLTSPSAAAFAAAPPSMTGAGASELAGQVPTPNTGEPRLVAPGQPQTGPAYSDETWNNRPRYDYQGGTPQAPSGAATVPVPQAPQPPLINGGQPGVYDMPGQQGMNDQANPLAAALAGGDQMPQLDQSALLAMALSQPDFTPTPAPDFAPPDFGGGFFGGLFG